MTVLKAYDPGAEAWQTIVVGRQGPAGVVQADAPLTYDAPTQTVGIDPDGYVASVNGATGTAVLDSDDIGEGTVNLYNRLPAAGSSGQSLVKVSGDDYDTAWEDVQLAGSAASSLNPAGAYFDGSTGLVLGGIAGNGAQVPDSPALSPTVAIDVRVKVTVANWTTGVAARLAAKNLGGSNRNWGFTLRSDRLLAAQVSSNGTSDTSAFNGNSAIAVPGTDGQPMWVRFTFTGDDGAGNKVGKFYYSTDGTSWVLMNSVSTAGTTSIFDSTAPVDIGGYVNLAFENLTGTIGRVVILDGFDGAGSTVLDANFETATAGALAFTESSTNAATVSLVTTRYNYGVPHAQWSTSNATQALTANRVYYRPFIVTAPTVVDMTVFRVTAGPASAANVRTGIYAADGDLQPLGAPVLDAGNVAVGTSATGNFYTHVAPVTLQPGMYLTAMKSSVNMTVQVIRGGITAADIGRGANAIESVRFGVQTEGAFPTPGTPWDTQTLAAVGANHTMFLRWSPA